MFALALVTSVCALRDPCSRQTCVENLREDTGELPVVLAPLTMVFLSTFPQSGEPGKCGFPSFIPDKPAMPRHFREPARAGRAQAPGRAWPAPGRRSGRDLLQHGALL